mmetsp:Transcript_40179/g.81098  ORF Transcript_40179/g.81098 Transcript_40179/m.81098 type:complete len:83 (-) Transcript_40179:385-633(-)
MVPKETPSDKLVCLSRLSTLCNGDRTAASKLGSGFSVDSAPMDMDFFTFDSLELFLAMPSADLEDEVLGYLVLDDEGSAVVA